MSFKEIECKVTCTATITFTLLKLASHKDCIRRVDFDGVDRFYAKATDPEMHEFFGRYRKDNNKEEFTVKRRLFQDNIIERIELNIVLGKGNSVEVIDTFYKELGCEFSYSLPKAGFFLEFPDVILSKYMVNKDVYFEIEVKEHLHRDPVKCTEVLEKYKHLFDISSEMCINASLPEIYKPKDTVLTTHSSMLEKAK